MYDSIAAGLAQNSTHATYIIADSSSCYFPSRKIYGVPEFAAMTVATLWLLCKVASCLQSRTAGQSTHTCTPPQAVHCELQTATQLSNNSSTFHPASNSNKVLPGFDCLSLRSYQLQYVHVPSTLQLTDGSCTSPR